MNKTIKNAFKETPPRFHYSVQSSINEAVSSPIKNKCRFSRSVRLVIAGVLILALIPSAAFGATKLYGLFIESQGIYAVRWKLSPDADTDYPEYVKLIVNPPDGFETRANFGEEKYCRVGEDAVSGFSMALFRLNPEDDTSALERDVSALDEAVISGHLAYFVTSPEGYDGWDRLFIYYESVNVTVLLFYHDVTREELEAFVAGISFVEGTKDDHTYIGTVEADDGNKAAFYELNEVFKELPLDTVITYSACNEEGERITFTSRISDIRFTENISSLDSDGFNVLYPYDEIADENGDLRTKTVTIFQEGNGIETPTSKVIDRKEAEQVMVLADITYTNKSDENVLLYADYWMNILRHNADGSYSHAENVDKEHRIFANAYCDTERTYQSDHGDSIKSFYSFSLSAYETKTITIGFRCNKDELDNAYLLIDPNSSEITSVDTREDINGANRYIFKVTNNG